MTNRTTSPTNRLLGHPDDARLLIINADDFGMCHAVNAAIFRAFENGVLRSTTLMVPCPWALHAMHYLADHPETPFGVHLTAISEWTEYRWKPVTSREHVPSLIDEAGFFYTFDRMAEFRARATLAELELEWRAQIGAVLAAGLAPSHLDWHSLRFGTRTDIIDLMVGLAKEYGLALRVIGRDVIERVQSQGLPTIDDMFLDSYSLDLGDKPALYARLLRELPAGLNEWAVHPGLANAELQAIHAESAQIRQTDFDFLVSQAARDIVIAEGIILMDYRPLQAIWKERRGN